MRNPIFDATVLGSIFIFVRIKAQTAGVCGSKSVANVPGCWGTPGCAYVIASNLGPGAECPYNYCNCGGVAVPLLPTVVSGTATIGCSGYTLQPIAKNCPTAVPILNLSASASQMSTSALGRTALSPETSTSASGKAFSAAPGLLPWVSNMTTSGWGSSALVSGTSIAATGIPDSTLKAIASSSRTLIPSAKSALASTTATSTPVTPSAVLVAPSITTPGAMSTVSVPVTSQFSVTDAFAVASLSETAIAVDGMTLHYSKANFPDLTTITAPVTHRHTIPAAVIIVGPGGNWWNGGIGGFGLHGSSCIWPFCPPGGGRGDASGGGSSGNNPKSPSNPHDNQDSSGTGKSTDSRQSSTAPPSSSTSCGATAVASDCSVFCPIATGISATRPCSTTCYSNETGCSASGTTATTTATGAPSQQVCDQSCSLCNAPPPGVATPTARMGKRNLPTSLKSIDKEALSVPSKEIEKRTLPDPSDAVYGGNVASFILEEFKKADKIPLRIDSNHPSSALVRKFNNERVNLAVYGLYGCTSVLVVSNQGIWASHFWENPSFVNANRFQNEVLVALEDGDGTDDMPGIRRYTGFREFLNVAEVPQAIIVTPRVRTSLVVGNLLFGVQVNQISTTLRGLIPNSIPIVIEYVPTDARTSQSTDNPSGKMLVQFDPDQRQYEAKKDCPAVQQARVSVWSGDRLEKIHNIDWAAEPNHVTAASKGKRDTPACSQRTLASYLSTIQATTGPAGSSIAASGGVSSYSVTASDGFSISASSTSLRSSILTTLRSLTVTPSSDAKSPSSTLNIVMFSTKSPPTPSISSASSAPASAGACLASSLAPGLSKVPGCWGVPRCAYYIAADQGLPADTPNYCNCGGTTAPLLTHSGTTDCAYTTQPASNIPLGTLPGGSGKGSTTPASAPRVTTAASPKLVVPPPPYVTGKCNIHVWEGLGEIGQKSVYLEANITDAKGGLVGFKSGGLDWNVALDVNSKLANVMIVTAQSGISRSLRKREDRHLSKRVGSAPPTRPLFEKGTVQFAVGAQKWDTTSKQCTAGVWNNGNANDFFGSLVFGDKFLPSRQMDCKFDC